MPRTESITRHTDDMMKCDGGEVPPEEMSFARFEAISTTVPTPGQTQARCTSGRCLRPPSTNAGFIDASFIKLESYLKTSAIASLYALYDLPSWISICPVCTRRRTPQGDTKVD
eukprot:6547105-Pyramimonas_sp.AAC.2